jgi:putative ABC transport system ATP-binding protein
MSPAAAVSSAPPCIRVRDLVKVYRLGSTEVQALRGVDLDIERGEMVAVMGSSGSGKSTLMNLLGCLDRPTSGTYELDGRRVDGVSKDELADVRNREIGFVFQGFHLLSRSTARGNVELPLLYDRSRRDSDPHASAEAVLARVGLGDRMHHRPTELSGGQQQRVAIARALVTRPGLLLADEPTGNLDSRTSIEIMALLQGLNRDGLTLLMVTHEADIAAHAHRIVELRDGKVIRDAAVLRPRSAAEEIAEAEAPA